MEKINITLVTDTHYFLYALTTIKSVAINTQSFVMCNLILNSKTTDSMYHTVLDLQQELDNLKIELINVDPQLVNNIQTKSYVSQAAFIKIYIPSILKSIDRTIYLDGDIYVNRDIKELWDSAFSNETTIAAAHDPMYTYDHPVIGLSSEDKAFNSGVMCLNLSKMRVNNDSEKLIEFIKDKNHLTKLNDQPAFNSVYKKSWKELSPHWNVLDTYFMTRVNLIDFDFQHNLQNNPYIIHFSGPAKPWKYRCSHPNKYLFINLFESITKEKMNLIDKNFISFLKKNRDNYKIKRSTMYKKY